MKPERFNFSLLFKLAPALIVAMFPLTVVEDFVLGLNYTLRSKREALEPVFVIEVPKSSGANLMIAGLEKIPNSKCASLVPGAVHKLDACKSISVSAYTLADDLIRDASLFLPSFSSAKEIPLIGKIARFNPISLENLISAPAPTTAAASLVIFVPELEAPAQKFETPIGPLSPTELAINALYGNFFGLKIELPHTTLRIAISITAAVLAAVLLYSYPIALSTLFLLIISAAHWALSILLFEHADIRLPVATPLLTILAVYILGMLERLNRREHEQWDLDQETANLKRLDEMRSNFLSLVSHDLKTPIARIQSVLGQLLRQDFGPLSTEQSASLQKLMSASGHLQHTISTLLLLGRIESRDLELKREPLDLKELLEISIREFQSMAEERQVSFSAELEPLFLVNLDGALIREVIQNILENALKYAPPKTRVVIKCGELQNCPELSPPQAGIWFEVQDFGRGIRQDLRAHIFRKFSKDDSELADSAPFVKGTGLGLYLCAYFVDRHGGSISVFSKCENEKMHDGHPALPYFGKEATSSGTLVRVSLPLESPT